MTAIATELPFLDLIGACLSVALLIYGACLAYVARFDAPATTGVPQRCPPSVKEAGE